MSEKQKQDSILIIDDDRCLTALLKEILLTAHYQVTVCHSGKHGLTQCKYPNHYDLILLDVMLPDMSGFDLLKSFRTSQITPVIMMTAKNHVCDRIKGLDSGADDFVCKPFAAQELLARMKAVLRRFNYSAAPEQQVILQNGPVKVHTKHLDAYFNDDAMPLTQTETRILIELMSHVEQAVSKQHLHEQIFCKRMEQHDRSLDMHMSNLRRKLYQSGSQECIRTIRKQGYIMMAMS